MIERSERWYKDGEAYYPRLTDVLSIIKEPELDKWKARVGDAAAIKLAAQTARVGTTVHKMIQDSILSGKLVKPSPRANAAVLGAWRAWTAWVQLTGGIPKGISEEVIVSARYGYGATLDFVEDGRVTEWKVTSRIRPSHWIQLMAQAAAKWSEPAGKMVRVVRMDAELGTYQVQEKVWSQPIFETFLHLKEVYEAWYFRPMIGQMTQKQQEEGGWDG